MKPEDDRSTTVEAAAAYERWRSVDDPHPYGCRCHACCLDEYDPAEEARG